MKNKLFIPLVIVILVLAVFILLKYPLRTPMNNYSQNNLAQTNIDLGTLPPWGNPQAPIKIVEFADFLCPYCARASIDLYPYFEQLINQGKVALYHRDFVVHPEAVIIHNAARCANEENKFWEFNKEVYKEFLNGKATYQKEFLVDLAKKLNLNVDNFKKCLEENRYLNQIQKDFEDGMKNQVEGTPTFFINNKKIVGLDIEGVKSTIDAFLK